MKIVVVEDEIRIREGIVNLINKHTPQHEVVGQAENGSDGFDVIKETRADLIITDVKMPIMDGLEMLEKLSREEYEFRAILLTAYSEFDYAQKAIALGVKEYLLKPITVDSLINAIEKIEKQTFKYSRMYSKNSIESILKSILSEEITPDNDLLQFIYKEYGITDTTLFAQIYCTFENEAKKTAAKTKQKIKEFLQDHTKNMAYIEFENKHNREIVFVFYTSYEGIEQIKALHKGLKHFRSRNSELDISIGWECTQGIANVKSTYDKLSSIMEWGTCLNKCALIETQTIEKLTLQSYSYPASIENEIKKALFAFRIDKVNEQTQKFIRYFEDNHFSPKDLKSSFNQMCWTILQLSKEIDILDTKSFNTHVYFDEIASATRFSSLEHALISLLSQIEIPVDLSTTSLTVNRAKSLIHEFYQTGISLEDISDRLNITPEYLGTLFKEKTGENFTAYIRNYRIKKAKELLLSTSLKLYEIAEKVGYADPKYFSRVFRDQTGQLPADYRKTHK